MPIGRQREFSGRDEFCFTRRRDVDVALAGIAPRSHCSALRFRGHELGPETATD